jgi:hypothetical protein
MKRVLLLVAMLAICLWWSPQVSVGKGHAARSAHTGKSKGQAHSKGGHKGKGHASSKGKGHNHQKAAQHKRAVHKKEIHHKDVHKTEVHRKDVHRNTVGVGTTVVPGGSRVVLPGTTTVVAPGATTVVRPGTTVVAQSGTTTLVPRTGMVYPSGSAVLEDWLAGRTFLNGSTGKRVTSGQARRDTYQVRSGSTVWVLQRRGGTWMVSGN